MRVGRRVWQEDLAAVVGDEVAAVDFCRAVGGEAGGGAFDGEGRAVADFEAGVDARCSGDGQRAAVHDEFFAGD